MNKNLISTTQLAEMLGISREAVFKKIKNGTIKAKKVGRNFVIDVNDLTDIFDDKISKKREKEIDAVVKRVVKEYGQTLELLGEE